jgi:hypothetical protein
VFVRLAPYHLSHAKPPAVYLVLRYDLEFLTPVTDICISNTETLISLTTWSSRLPTKLCQSEVID